MSVIRLYTNTYPNPGGPAATVQGYDSTDKRHRILTRKVAIAEGVEMGAVSESPTVRRWVYCVDGVAIDADQYRHELAWRNGTEIVT